jgi:hypothetical protein
MKDAKREIISPVEDFDLFNGNFPGSASFMNRNRGFRGELSFLRWFAAYSGDEKLMASCVEQQDRVRRRKLSQIDKVADSISTNGRLIDVKTCEMGSCGISMRTGVLPKGEVIYVCVVWTGGSLTKRDELRFAVKGWCYGSELVNVSHLPNHVWVPKDGWKDIDSLPKELC